MASSNAALDPPGKLRGRPVLKYGPKAFVPQFKYMTVDYRHRLDACWHWIHGFKKRHGLTFRGKTRIGQDSNEDGDAMLADFSERVQLSAMTNDVETIYNADQTAVNYEYLPTKTLNPTKENTVG
ncbi:hypothetical protein DYB37_012600 [Aphanomyces astaci]|uniref:DDE-1 domain-containing protein n=1 Tax=Aphanomyces astaci TaxID=112090 RepID=A0A3R6YGX2_APHAT|nr:hypothetical protein DYB37_012600 [Aphanomyces astaci]